MTFRKVNGKQCWFLLFSQVAVINGEHKIGELLLLNIRRCRNVPKSLDPIDVGASPLESSAFFCNNHKASPPVGSGTAPATWTGSTTPTPQIVRS